jgi:hypothetical protein
MFKRSKASCRTSSRFLKESICSVGLNISIFLSTNPVSPSYDNCFLSNCDSFVYKSWIICCISTILSRCNSYRADSSLVASRFNWFSMSFWIISFVPRSWEPQRSFRVVIFFVSCFRRWSCNCKWLRCICCLGYLWWGYPFLLYWFWPFLWHPTARPSRICFILANSSLGFSCLCCCHYLVS